MGKASQSIFLIRSCKRRDILKAASLVAATAVTAFAGVRSALAEASSTEEAVRSVIAGRRLLVGGINLDIPEVAENGQMVQTTVAVEQPMNADEHVVRIHLFGDGNPRPRIATFHYGTNNGGAWTSVRIRLARTQNVIALAELSSGVVLKAQKNVRVTVGGCG